MEESYNIATLGKFLEDFGFSAKQARIYLASLHLGPSSIQTIAKEAKLQRTNAYDAVETLVAKGLMSISTKGKKRFFMAEPPEVLKKILDAKRETLENVLPQLALFHASSEHKPKIRYYPGIDGYKQAYEDTLTAKEKKLFGIFSVQDMWDVIGREVADHMVERRIKRGISLQVIRSKEKDVGYVYPTSKKELREMRHAPPGMVFPITTYVYDNKVVILSSKKELFGLVIESEDIAQAHRLYFEALWQISSPA